MFVQNRRKAEVREFHRSNNLAVIAGPPSIFQHTWFQSLAGLSTLPDQQRSQPRGPGIQIQSLKLEMGTDLPTLAGLEFQNTVTGGKFDPTISAVVPMRSRPTASPGLGAIFWGGLQGDISSVLLSFCSFEKVPDLQLLQNRWWTCITEM